MSGVTSLVGLRPTRPQADAAPAFGMFHYEVMEFNFSEGSPQTKTIEIPKNSFQYDIGIHVHTLYNSGTSDLLDIGDEGDPDGFVTQASLRTGGPWAAGRTIWLYRHAPAAPILGAYLSDTVTTNVINHSSQDLYLANETFTATVTKTGTAATAGRVFIIPVWGSWHPFDLME